MCCNLRTDLSTRLEFAAKWVVFSGVQMLYVHFWSRFNKNPLQNCVMIHFSNFGIWSKSLTESVPIIGEGLAFFQSRSAKLEWLGKDDVIEPVCGSSPMTGPIFGNNILTVMANKIASTITKQISKQKKQQNR